MDERSMAHAVIEAEIERMIAERPKASSTFYVDEEGRPKGGESHGAGLNIRWQDGVREPWGATLEDVLEACAQRLRFFQRGEFRCEENQAALNYIEAAIGALNLRTEDRKARGVEGTYTP